MEHHGQEAASHGVPSESHEAAHEEWGTSPPMTESFPVSQ